MKNYLKYLQEISSPQTFQRKIDYTKYNLGSYIKSKDDKKEVLEVGPGLGENIQYLNSQRINHVDLLDNNKDILKYLSDNYKINNTFEANDIKKIDKELGLYDLIIGTQVLEHIKKEEQQVFLSILYEHLKKGGVIALTVPNMANPFTLCERYADITHETSFTDNSLMELAMKCDISKSKIKIKPFSIPPYSLINKIRIPLQKTLHFFILVLSIINGGSYSKILTPNITLIVKK
ncbi:MAG: class I SAM-dependent methyltransferase [Candidatus Moranbacteria bacterium]|nr:class I SAM-dependent methyltransferase [Candidatus Moranbacteria bacterium]